MSDDLRELIGRYATGSLSEQERARLFEAALDDQELFDELAREQGVRQLLVDPGARQRIERALEPPKRGAAWFALAAVSGLVAASAVIFVMMRPAPKPAPQVVAVVNPAPQPVQAIHQSPAAAPAPVHAEPVSKEPPAKKKAALDEVARDTESDKKEAGAAGKNEVRKDEPVQAEAAEQKVATLVAAGAPAPPPAPAAQDAAKQQNAPGGPRQQQQPAAASRSAFAQVPPVAFHYSYDSGHLKILASTPGFLTIRTSAGVLLYATQAAAAGSTVDVALPDDAASIIVVFSYQQTPGATKPEPHTEPSGNLLAPGTAALELKIPR